MDTNRTYNNYAYYILPIEMAAGLNYNALQEESVDTVRTNNAGTLCVVEYKGENPEGTWLTHEEVLAILETPDWISNFNELNQTGSFG